MFSEKYFLISDYQAMELLGVDGLFTNQRVERESLPEGFYMYSLRRGDENPFSTVEKNVAVDHMGDFICKQELNLNGQDEFELFDEYGFTDDEVDLDNFFGVDIKGKIAEEIDNFRFDFDPYEYKDNLPSGFTREDAVASIKDDLNDISRVSGMIKFFENILSNNEDEDFLDKSTEQKVRSFVSVLTEINSHNREPLDNIVGLATEIKEKQTQNSQTKEPEI